MKRLTAVVGFAVALFVARGSGQVAYGVDSLPECLVTFCGTEHGDVIDTCVPSGEINPKAPGDIGGGGQADLDPGVCKTFVGKKPCQEIPECVVLFATRQTPTLGGSALLLTALVLGGAGTVRLRRRLRSS